MGGGRDYICGAFNGGTSAAFLNMCRVLAKNVQTDLSNDIIACVDDESHLNAYLSKHKYLLCGRAYGFPEDALKHLQSRARVMVKIISRHKDSPRYGGTRWLRGQTDKRIPNNWFTRNVMRIFCRYSGLLIPVRKWRHKYRSYFG